MLLADLDLLRDSGSRAIAVNNTWALVPRADVLYAGDAAWWERYGSEARHFKGEKWTRSPEAANKYGLHLAEHEQGNHLPARPRCVSLGGNSGHQAVCLAYAFGARRIVLLGFDMHRKQGGHWHGEHEGMLSAPDKHITRWVENFKTLYCDLRFRGIEVINATEGSALSVPYKPLREALK
jgi:hypothetical protein